MRAIIFLLLLAGGAAAWYWYTNRPAGNPDDPFGPTTPDAVHADPLPADALKAQAEADALWSAAGSDAARSPDAPRIARLYSQVLLAMYPLTGQHDAMRSLIDERLAPLGEALFLSRARWPDDATGLMGVHSVSPGENPDAIARGYGMSREWLNILRGKDPNSADLRAGETLKIVKVRELGGNRIEVSLARTTLDLFIGGVFARRYNISIGAPESPTPTGSTRLTDRVWQPQWTHPATKKVIPYGDPENILGPVWMPFDAALLGDSGIGIHGYTGADARLNAEVSNGCVRMQNDDVEQLFHLVAHPQRAPTEVEIRR